MSALERIVGACLGILAVTVLIKGSVFVTIGCGELRIQIATWKVYLLYGCNYRELLRGRVLWEGATTWQRIWVRCVRGETRSRWQDQVPAILFAPKLLPSLSGVPSSGPSWGVVQPQVPGFMPQQVVHCDLGLAVLYEEFTSRDRRLLRCVLPNAVPLHMRSL